jgi:hypothetical protein
MHTAAIDRLIHLGESIDSRGVSSVDVDLLLLAHDARDLGIEPVLVDVMIDDDAPAVVRERAFSLVAARMGALPELDEARRITEPLLSSPVGAGR